MHYVRVVSRAIDILLQVIGVVTGMVGDILDRGINIIQNAMRLEDSVRVMDENKTRTYRLRNTL